MDLLAELEGGSQKPNQAKGVDLLSELEAIPTQQASMPINPPSEPRQVTPLSQMDSVSPAQGVGGMSTGGRTGRVQAIRSEDQRISNLLSAYSSGQLSSVDVSASDLEKIRLARIEAIPEITGSFKELSKNLGFTQALAGMTAFDPDEFGKILSAADPNIGIVTTPEGERLAVNRKTNEMMSINKAGPSLMDAIQIGGAAATFTPSGALQGVARQAGGAALTQGLIEAGQSYVGGEFNPEEVAIAGGSVPVIAGAAKYAKGALDNFRRSIRSSKSLIDQGTGEVLPEFQRALNKYDIDAGALIDDQGNLPVIYSGDKPEQVVESIVKKQIKTGKTPNYLAKLRLDRKGNIVKDDLGDIAVKQGFDPGDVVSIKQANSSTREAARDMLNKQRAIMADSSKIDQFRPSDVVGDSVLERFRYVTEEAKNLSKQLHAMSRKELGKSSQKLIGNGDGLKGLGIDPSGIEKSVIDGLDNIGIERLDDILASDTPIYEAVKKSDFFDGSDIMKDPTSQKIIRDVFDLLSYQPDAPVDALRAHKVKRQIDKLIDFNKKGSKGLTEEGKRFAMSIRRAMNDSIREVSPKYAQINDQLSMALEAINNIEQSMGRRVDLFDANANQAMGQEVRKLLSNYGVRQTLNNSLTGIDDAAKALGGKFDTDFRALNRFANVLDRRFGSAAKNSFTESINSALDLNRLRNTSVKEAVIEKGLGKIADKFGPNDKKALDTMNKILVRGK